MPYKLGCFIVYILGKKVYFARNNIKGANEEAQCWYDSIILIYVPYLYSTICSCYVLNGGFLSDPGSYIAFSRHALLASFSLKRFLGLSWHFMKLASWGV